LIIEIIVELTHSKSRPRADQEKYEIWLKLVSGNQRKMRNLFEGVRKIKVICVEEADK
jgi:hypothetical protein